MSSLCYQHQEAPHHLIGSLVTARRIIMLDNAYPVTLEEAVALMILNGALRRMEWLAIDFKDAPASVVADEKIRFAIDASIGTGDAAEAEWKEEDTGTIESLGDPDFGHRPEAETTPSPWILRRRSLIMDALSPCDFGKLNSPRRIEVGQLHSDRERVKSLVMWKGALQGVEDLLINLMF